MWFGAVKIWLTVYYTEAVIIVICHYGISCYWLLRDSMGLANLLVERRQMPCRTMVPDAADCANAKNFIASPG